MRALPAQSLRRSMVRRTTLALAIGIAACETPTAPPTPGANVPQEAVIVRVSSLQAVAGDVVTMELQAPALDERGMRILASVSWDARAFEYVEADPAQSFEIVQEDHELGWMIVRSAQPRLREAEGIELRFRALADSETSGFSADARLVRQSAHEPEEELIHW